MAESGHLPFGQVSWLASGVLLPGPFPSIFRQWASAGYLAYSGATAADFHRLPYSPWVGT